jgi:hypothetical protein
MKKLFLARIYYELWINNKTSEFKKLKKHFENLTFKDRKLVLYRGVGLSFEQDPTKRNLGICWTFNIDKAFAYNGKGTPHKFFYRYHALIPFKSINWKRTIELSLDNFTYEKEIRMHYQKPVYLYKCDKIIILPCFKDNEKWQFPKQIHSVNYKNVKYFT